jgi:hypothetical protein
MPIEHASAPMLRRLGDIIQGLAVIAIAGLVVVVIDLRITIVQNQDMINAQDKLHSHNFKALRENIELQMKIFESIVQRASTSGFDSNRGIALQENVRIISQKIEKNETDIKQLHEKIYECYGKAQNRK